MCTQTGLEGVLGLDKTRDHRVVGVAVERNSVHHSRLGLTQKLSHTAHRSLLHRLTVKVATKRGVYRNRARHTNLRSNKVHVLRNGPNSVGLSDLQWGGDDELMRA